MQRLQSGASALMFILAAIAYKVALTIRETWTLRIDMWPFNFWPAWLWIGAAILLTLAIAYCVAREGTDNG